MTVCYLEKPLSLSHLHGHQPGSHMFAVRWKGFPQGSEHQLCQAGGSEDAEVHQAQTDVGTYSFEGLSGLMDPETIDNSTPQEGGGEQKKKTLKIPILCSA